MALDRAGVRGHIPRRNRAGKAGTQRGIGLHRRIAVILQPWVDTGHLPADTNAQLAALIESKRGQQLVVYDAFPQLFKDMSKTLEQMISAGLLVDQN